MLISLFLLTTLYTAIGILILPIALHFVTHHNVMTVNFEGKYIPTGIGLYIWIMFIIFYVMLKATSVMTSFYAMYVPLFAILNMPTFGLFVVAITIIFVVGWIDDTLGDSRIKGFVGHWQQWRRHRLMSTGLIKVWLTAVAALLLCIEISPNLIWAGCHFAIMLLMTNTLNLFDLRPGRALKVFTIMSAIVLMCGTWHQVTAYLLPIIVPAAIVFRKDLKAELMLGDTGSNALGFALGFTICVATPFWFQMIILLLTITLHAMAMKYSLTHIIAEHRLLHWLDQWGRT